MDILVRPAQMEDVPALARILVEGWSTAYMDLLSPEERTHYLNVPRREAQFRRFLDNGELLWLGLLHGEPCGLLFASRENDEDLLDCGFIYSLYLKEAAYGSGLAPRLMEEALSALAGAGLERVALWVIAENGRARRFYEKQGFRPDGATKTGRFAAQPLELCYVKALPQAPEKSTAPRKGA